MPGKMQQASYIAVSRGYFDALRIPVISGRGFTQGDSIQSVPVAVISRKLAETYFHGENPIGRRIRMGDHSSTDPWLTVVGVTEEVNYSLWEEYQRPALYVSEAQQPQTEVTIAVITNGNPLSLASAARKAIASVDPGLPVDPVETYSTLVRDDMVGLIYAAVMLSIDAFVALLLSGIGILVSWPTLWGNGGARLAYGLPSVRGKKTSWR